MNIIVCIKQVPANTRVEVDPKTGALIRDGIDNKLNPYDLYALETAFLLAEQGETVRTLTMGPPQAKEALLEAVYMGADEGVLVSDRRFAGADVLATAYTLSQAIKGLGPYDLILCGKQTTDGDTAQVGAELAELLGIPHAGNVYAIQKAADSRIVVSNTLENFTITQSILLPCLLCMDGDINTPRLPSYKRKISLFSQPVRELTLDDLEERDERNYGLMGSPTQVERIFPPQNIHTRHMLKGNSRELTTEIAGILKKHRYI